MKTDLGILTLRLYFGATMLFAHGLPKLMKFSLMKDSFPDPLGVGNSLSLGLVILSEVVCAALISLGFFTRLACIPISITMFVAVFVIHSNDPFSKQELGLAYLAAYIAIALIGPGRFSVDSFFKRR